MPRLEPERRAALEALIASQDQIVTAAQLRELGVGRSSINYRIDVARRWRRLLPGIYLAHRETPTDAQRRRAAILYAGSDAVLTGTAALQLHGSRVASRTAGRDPLLLLVPHHRQRSSAGFVVIERTTRMPRALVRADVPVAPTARAAIDAARRIDRRGDVAALLADVVQAGLVTPRSLGDELAAAQRRGTRHARSILAPLLAGTRSAPEVRLRQLWLRSGLPEPLWNPALFTMDGEFIARPDAYLVDEGIAVEVDSKEFHLSPADWEHTMLRHAGMTANDIAVLHVPPVRLNRSGSAFLDDLRATVRARSGRPPPRVQVIPLT